MLKFVRWLRRRLASLSPCHCVGAERLSRQADPTRRRVRARRRDRHLRAADSNDLQDALGQPVVIENRPGAGGYLAWNHVASADPDGYTLLLAENARRHQPGALQEIEVDVRSADAVRRGHRHRGLAVGAGRRQQRPGQDGDGAGRLFRRRCRRSSTSPRPASAACRTSTSRCSRTRPAWRRVHVPYKGGGQAIGDVIAGHVPMTITSVQATKGLVESGKVRALAVTSPARSPAMPDVPTMQEAGVPPADVELRFWFAIFGPKGLPEPVKTRLSQAIREGDERSGGARAARQARHHAGRRSRPGDARQARKRDQELDALHRRQGHQGGIARGTAKCRIPSAASPYRRQPRARGRMVPPGLPIGGSVMLHFIRWCSIVCALLGVPALAQAQSHYPDRPIRFVIAFPPGGATDTFFRQISHELGDSARPAGRDREPRRRRRLYRLAAGRELADPTATRCWSARTRIGISQALFKKHPSGFDPLKDYDAIAAMGTRRWCSASPTTCRPRTSPSSWPIRRPCRRKLNYAHAGIGTRVASGVRGASATPPA